MKPTLIPEVLDLALEIRKAGRVFNPLFAGDAGIGKSEICQAWAKAQRKKDPNFGFLDLRLALMEAQDLIGTPREANGRTTFMLPDFWPKEGSGLLLLEEPNRAHTSVTNAIMQLLTDRKVHGYQLPEGWIIAGAINPETTAYDVNTMDAALRNRFQVYEVNYDKQTFVEHMKDVGWHSNVINFVNSGVWTFKPAPEITEGGTYISPRSLKALSNAELAGVATKSRGLHLETATSILGKHVGKDYYNFVYEQSPVMFADLVSNEKQALKKLAEYSNEKNYRGDMVGMTSDSVVEHYPEAVSNELLIKVAKILPKDQAVNMLSEAYMKLVKKNDKQGKFSDFITSLDADFAKLLKERVGKK
jgi:hypothetical protein